VRTGDGLYSAASGNPTVPAWLGRLMFGMFFTPGAENDKYARHIRSSASLARGPGVTALRRLQVGAAAQAMQSERRARWT
jgi:hypothetical protein